jgi:hypothetical protein
VIYVLLVFIKRDRGMELVKCALQTPTLKLTVPVVNAILVIRGQTTANVFSALWQHTKTFLVVLLATIAFLTLTLVLLARTKAIVYVMQDTRVQVKTIVLHVHWARQKHMGLAIVLDVFKICSQILIACVSAMLVTESLTTHALLVKKALTNQRLVICLLQLQIVIQW